MRPLLKHVSVPFSLLAGKARHLLEISRVWQEKETPGADLLGAVTSLIWRTNPKPEKKIPHIPSPPKRFICEYVEQTSMRGISRWLRRIQSRFYNQLHKPQFNSRFPSRSMWSRGAPILTWMKLWGQGTKVSSEKGKRKARTIHQH